MKEDKEATANKRLGVTSAIPPLI